ESKDSPHEQPSRRQILAQSFTIVSQQSNKKRQKQRKTKITKSKHKILQTSTQQAQQ
ncbi:hypothetical protein GIB67_010593, partial [Kingdonia uniflora]